MTNTDYRQSKDENSSVLASLRALAPNRRATFAEALRVAEQQAQRLLHRLGIDSGPISEDLLYQLPRVSVEYVNQMPTSGCSFWDGTSWVIQVNAREPATRQRFTLFHEYKHIVDHGRADQLYGTGTAAATHAEQIADFFAGCVLMPRPLVKRAWAAGNQTADALATVFEASPAAAAVRLAQIGLTDPPIRCTIDASRTARTSRRRLNRSIRSYYRQLSPAFALTPDAISKGA